MEATDILNFSVEHTLIALFLFAIGYCLYLALTRLQKPKKTLFSAILLIVYSALVAGGVFYYGIRQEKEERIKWAEKIARHQDTASEVAFIEKVRLIESDSTASILAQQAQPGKLEEYLEKKYFTEQWRGYHFFLTCCRAGETLQIGDSPTGRIVPCNAFFEEKIERLGKCTKYQNLYTIDYGIEYYTYLYSFSLNAKQKAETKVFIEWGRPKLESHSGELPLNYSYAYYVGDNLWSHSGSYLYDFRINEKNKPNTKISKAYKNGAFFIKDKDFSHYVFPLYQGHSLILSAPLPTFSRLLYDFSFYLCLFFFLSLVCELFRRPNDLRPHSYAQRLQYTIFGLVFCAFVLLGIVSFFFIKDLNDNEQKNSLREKALTVLSGMESFYMNLASNDPLSNEEPQAKQPQDKQQTQQAQPHNNLRSGKELIDLIIDLSQTLSIDIYIFDKNGHFVFSSCEEHSNRNSLNLKSIFDDLNSQRSHLIIQKEELNEDHSLVAYTPFRNVENEIIGYAMLPSYISQSAWRTEVSRYLSLYLNIFVLLSLLTLAVSYLLSNYVTKPLKLLSKSVAEIKLTEKNTILSWTSHDEIGELVQQYNRMVSELEQSARTLAESERRSVWSQMAKQVAHEIKNPLTPLQLQMQQLERAYKDNRPDFDIRLKNFSSLLSAQIELLSSIADTFSKLSQWTQPHLKSVSILEMIQSATTLFTAKENISISVGIAGSHLQNEDITINADPQFVNQILTNLLSNAVQALEEENVVNPCIAVEARLATTCLMIDVKDNGPGIIPQRMACIFEPHFTTRSSGSGLGLAISRQMAESMNGSLTVENLQEGGACFTLTLPLTRPL